MRLVVSSTRSAALGRRVSLPAYSRSSPSRNRVKRLTATFSPVCGTDLVQQGLDRLRLVLDERLVQQDVVLEERLEFPFDDPGDHVLGLPRVERLLLEDLPLVLQGRRGNIVAG
jgi:hypothetical protein